MSVKIFVTLWYSMILFIVRKVLNVEMLETLNLEAKQYFFLFKMGHLCKTSLAFCTCCQLNDYNDDKIPFKDLNASFENSEETTKRQHTQQACPISKLNCQIVKLEGGKKLKKSFSF